MKKLTFVLIFLWGSFAFLNAQQTAEFTLPNMGAQTPGTVIHIPFTLNNITNNIGAMQFFIDYNPAVLTPLSPYFSNNHPSLPQWFCVPQVPAGEMFYSWYDFNGIGVTVVAPTIVGYLDFTYNGGYTTLTFSAGKGIASDPKAGANGIWWIDTDYSSYAYDFLILNPGSVGVSAPTAETWTGNVSSVWDVDGNWLDGSAPLPGADIIIPAVTTKAVSPVITFGPIIVGNLTINDGGWLTIGAGGALTVNGLTTIHSDNIIPAGRLHVLDGSFIDNGFVLGVPFDGEFRYERFTGPTYPSFTDARGWHFISSPVAGFTSNNIYDYWLNYYDEAQIKYVHVEGNPAIPCDPGFRAWAPSEGWSVKFDMGYLCNATNPGTGTTIDFASAAAGVHTGAVPFGWTSLGLDPPHWNLEGNPYASSIDANLLFPVAGLNNQIAQWGGDGQGWLQWSPLFPLLNNIVAPTQGFFVSAIAGGGFNFAHAMRVHGGTFVKSEVDNAVILQATGNGYSDKVYIRFMDGTTANFDSDWDAFKLFSGIPEAPQIFTVADYDLAIDGRPATETIPMTFKVGVSGTYTIEAIETSEFANVVLEDLVNGIQTDLLAGSYTFEDNASGDHQFIIHFTPLGTPELNANSINIWAADHNIYVQAPVTTGDIVVYNMMGQEVVRTDIEAGLNVIPMTDVNTYYIVKVIGSDITETGKVFIK